MEMCIKPTILQHFAGVDDVSAIAKGRKGSRIRKAAVEWYLNILERAEHRTLSAKERMFVEELRGDFNDQELLAVLTKNQLLWLKSIAGRLTEVR